MTGKEVSFPHFFAKGFDVYFFPKSVMVFLNTCFSSKQKTNKKTKSAYLPHLVAICQMDVAFKKKNLQRPLSLASHGAALQWGNHDTPMSGGPPT
jgi:hypothetical protein